MHVARPFEDGDEHPFNFELLSIENRSCINNFTRSIGATTVLAKAPAMPPATASLAGVRLFATDFEDGGDGATATADSDGDAQDSILHVLPVNPSSTCSSAEASFLPIKGPKDPVQGSGS